MIYKLLFDTGLLVLIWMTQLVVYPSFTQFSPDELMRWHGPYTSRISLIVMPLMLGQITFHLIGLRQDMNMFSIIALSFILLAWINTFFFAVPLHNQIAAGTDVMDAAQKLVPVNAWRTGFWTIVFVIDLALLLNEKIRS